MMDEDLRYQSNTDESIDLPSKFDSKAVKHIFIPQFAEDTCNGLYFNNIYIPEEVVTLILSYVKSSNIPNLSLVCRKWFNITRSHLLWFHKYTRNSNKKPKRLPWYVYYLYYTSSYFHENLIKNGNGQKQYKDWNIVKNQGHRFKIEKIPRGSDPLPVDVPDFRGHTGCFVSSFGDCEKHQIIQFEKFNLLRFILDKYKPIIYVSEWVAARFDCGGYYTLGVMLFGQDYISHKPLLPFQNEDGNVMEQEYYVDSEPADEGITVPLFQRTECVALSDGDVKWSKVELKLEDYPPGATRIVFGHKGRDSKFWAGHYGSKMAGAVVKILFDSIKENE